MILLDSRVEVMGPAEAEVEVEVEVVRDISRQDGRDRVIDTARIAAMHGGIGDARFQVATENHALRLVPGPRTGHAAFDEACRVDATDEDALRYWLGADEAAAILTLPAAYGAAWSLAVEPWHVELRICAGVEVKGLGLIERLRRAPRPADALPPLIADVDAAVRCIGLLASRSHRLAGTWRTRLAPLGLIAAPPVWGTAPTYVATLGHGRSRATLDFPWLAAPLPAERLRTRLTIEWPFDGVVVACPGSWPRGTRPRADELSEREVDGWYTLADPAGAELLRTRCDMASLTEAQVDWLLIGEQQLAIGWERIMEDGPRLQAALLLLARWSDHALRSDGPFR